MTDNNRDTDRTDPLKKRRYLLSGFWSCLHCDGTIVTCFKVPYVRVRAIRKMKKIHKTYLSVAEHGHTGNIFHWRSIKNVLPINYCHFFNICQVGTGHTGRFLEYFYYRPSTCIYGHEGDASFPGYCQWSQRQRWVFRDCCRASATWWRPFAKCCRPYSGGI